MPEAMWTLASLPTVPLLTQGTGSIVGKTPFEGPPRSGNWRTEHPGVVQAATPTANPSEEEQVFDHLVALKILTSNVAMHLDKAWRSGLFRQLDNLMSAEDWDFSDNLPSLGSFRTFLRMAVHNRQIVRPGLGATSDGHIVAAWTVDRDRLTIECMADDTVRWVLVKYVAGERVSAAGTSPVKMLHQFLEPYAPERWFGEAN